MIWTFGTLLGGVGMAAGVLIGLALGKVGESIAIGFLAGAIAGLVVGIRPPLVSRETWGTRRRLQPVVGGAGTTTIELAANATT